MQACSRGGGGRGGGLGCSSIPVDREIFVFNIFSSVIKIKHMKSFQQRNEIELPTCSVYDGSLTIHIILFMRPVFASNNMTFSLCLT